MGQDMVAQGRCLVKGTLLSLAGFARVGKGTFVSILDEILLERRPSRHVTEIAFAHALKLELDPMLVNRFGISAFTADNEDKKIIRPYLVERGAGARAVDPNHWIKLVEPDVKRALDRGDVVVISDSRYRNECDFVHSLGGKVIYIERIQPDGTPVPPANSEEAAQDGGAREVSDFFLSWPTFSTNSLDNMRPYVLNVWSQLTTNL